MEAIHTILNICSRPAECCQYRSIRYIRVHDKKIATTYWLLMIFVVCYIVGFTIIKEKGYQATAVVKGTTSVKIKGSACIGDLENYKDITELLPLDRGGFDDSRSRRRGVLSVCWYP